MSLRLKRSVNQKPLFELISPENFTPRGKGEIQESSKTEFRIPIHQRFPSWSLSKKQRLVDSVLRNYPIHAIIATRKLENDGLDVIVYFDIEDGQTRMTALQEYYMDEFACECGDDSIGNGKKFSELSPTMKQHFINYQVTMETFSGDRNTTNNDIAEIFNRLNSGKSLSDNDKFHSRDETPVLKKLVKVTNNSELKPDFNHFIGQIGGGKTRKGLSDMVGAILSIATKTGDHGGKACINTSYELNHRYLALDFAEDKYKYADIIKFFKSYFEMLHSVIDSITSKPRKNFGKLSGVLGLSVYSWITTEKIHPAIGWYTSKLVHDPKYEPDSFRQLTKGDIRNCQGDSVYRRLCKIIEQYEHDIQTLAISGSGEILLYVNEANQTLNNNENAEYSDNDEEEDSDDE